MPFHVEISESLVLDFLGKAERLSVADLDKILDFLDGPGGLPSISDEQRNDPSRRCAPESHTFWVDFVFRDSAGHLRQFRFVVNDDSAAVGVLRVVFAEEAGG
jgi:hypothetical protein